MSSIRHRASIVQQAMKMACKGSCVLLDGARSAPEANFHQNPQKCQSLRKSTKSSKFPKVGGCKRPESPKVFLRLARPPISQKFSNL